ncbi:DNA polymerase I [Planococcus halotolerans]|uniref:DNA polymerase I n=1 Tax=Planococcus halotolerans TaxID=2233542 RepID=A0A365KLU5_9BACL|nr:DNA polymerase I [Planococcus halotolerans]QHJ71684.1 DNA polymerase I [Planococcus halotolerans]RAZ74099.1 DNA polymerase I [Planococcus halotolerans]
MAKKILLLDGNSLAYRAFFALPLLTNENGIHTNAVYGFTMMLQRILEEEKPTHMMVAFDAGKTTFRHETFSEYKGGRQKTPPELSEQFPYLRKLIDAYRIKQYELPNYEADDIIGTLSLEAEKQGDEVIVISGDKDLTQLASPSTTVYITRKGITDIEKYTVDHIKEKYGLTPLQIIDMKGLMGDSSDNIPGVPGVGEKTALKLLAAHGSVEGVYEAIEQQKGKMKEKLVANEDLAYISKKLATIERQAPVEVKIDELGYEGPDQDELIRIWNELAFKSLLEKMEYTAEETVKEELKFSVSTEVQPSILKDEMAVHLEMYDEHYHTCDLLGVALSDETDTYVIPMDVAKESETFKAWLADPSKKKYMSDSKASTAAFLRSEIELDGVDFDLMLGAYIVNPSLTYTDMANIVLEYGYTDVSTNEQVYGKGAKKKVPEDDILNEHIARKARAIWKVRDIIIKKLEENQQFDLYDKLELPLATVLGKMESLGVKVDRAQLSDMGEELAAKLKTIESEIYSLAGQEFNINSPKQLGVILFEKLGLPALKKTKTGYSTAADVLEKLEGQHEIISHILLYRQLGKLLSTYIEGLLKEIHDDGKIHTRFQQALTTTGRLSSTNPNLQNIPVRLEEGRKIRKAFVPSEPDWVMVAADYSQIELRVLAHMSEDERLVQAFKDDQDIHTATAADVFHVPLEEVTGDMRRAAKAVNFGIVYGISDYGLSQSLNIPRKEAAEFIDRYLKSFPGVQQYMTNIVSSAKKDGFVTTLMNRRRYLPDITSSNFNLRSFAERTAMNTPIQGSAADIIKKAMIDMDEALEREGLKANMLLQVHDELIFEAPKDELSRLMELVPKVMESAMALNVPLKVDIASGDTWYETK